MVGYVVETVNQLGPWGIGFIFSMDAIIALVNIKDASKEYIKNMLRIMIKCTCITAITFIVALVFLSSLAYLIGGILKL